MLYTKYAYLRPKAGGLRPQAESPAAGRKVKAEDRTSPHAAGGVGRQRRRTAGRGEPALGSNDRMAMLGQLVIKLK